MKFENNCSDLLNFIFRVLHKLSGSHYLDGPVFPGIAKIYSSQNF